MLLRFARLAGTRLCAFTDFGRFRSRPPLEQSRGRSCVILGYGRFLGIAALDCNLSIKIPKNNIV
jgi:hypothetical protein